MPDGARCRLDGCEAPMRVVRREPRAGDHVHASPREQHQRVDQARGDTSSAHILANDQRADLERAIEVIAQLDGSCESARVGGDEKAAPVEIERIHPFAANEHDDRVLIALLTRRGW